MSLFLRLPNELLILIADELPLSDRTALLRTNRYLHHVLTGDFYRTALATDRGLSALKFAAKTGSSIVASLMISTYNVDPDIRFYHSRLTDQTVLHVAASKGYLQLVQRLAVLGADLQARNHAGRTPLHNAAYAGELEIVRTLVTLGADVMARDSLELTPLHSAAKKGRSGVCHYLLDQGAMVDAMSKDPQNGVDNGYTALHAAADFGHGDVALLLLNSGADVDAKIEHSEWTPLGCACAEGHEAVVEHLLRFGAEVNVSPETPLRLAVDGKWHEGVLRLLLGHGADVGQALDGLALQRHAWLSEFADRWESSLIGGSGACRSSQEDSPGTSPRPLVLPSVGT